MQACYFSSKCFRHGMLCSRICPCLSKAQAVERLVSKRVRMCSEGDRLPNKLFTKRSFCQQNNLTATSSSVYTNQGFYFIFDAFLFKPCTSISVSPADVQTIALFFIDSRRSPDTVVTGSHNNDISPRGIIHTPSPHSYPSRFRCADRIDFRYDYTCTVSAERSKEPLPTS